MPLVVPELAAGSNDEWLNKLVGKKISESGTSDVTTFAKKDLPEDHRILKPNDPVTADHKPNRLNIYLNDEGIVQNVNFA